MLLVEVVEDEGGDGASDNANDVHDAAAEREEALKRDDHDGGGDDDADDGVECHRIAVLEQGVNRLGQQDDGCEAANSAGDQDSKVHMADSRDKGLVQSKRHEQRREAHARRDNAECKAESAEHVPQEVGSDGDGEQPEANEQSKDEGSCDDERSVGRGAATFLACLAEQRRQHAGDKTNEHAHRRCGVGVK